MKTQVLVAAVALRGTLGGTARAEETPAEEKPAKDAPAEKEPAKDEPTAGVQFFQGTHTEALAEAKADGKDVFVFANTRWCGTCRWMSANVFTDAEVGTWFNEHFVSLNMDMERGEGLELARSLGIRAYPTLIVFDATGKELKRDRTAKNAAELLTFVQEAATP